MKSTFKKNSVSPKSSPINTTRQTLTTAKGNRIFNVWVLTKHSLSDDGNIVISIIVRFYHEGELLKERRFWVDY